MKAQNLWKSTSDRPILSHVATVQRKNALVAVGIPLENGARSAV